MTDCIDDVFGVIPRLLRQALDIARAVFVLWHHGVSLPLNLLKESLAEFRPINVLNSAFTPDPVRLPLRHATVHFDDWEVYRFARRLQRFKRFHGRR